VKFEVRYPTGAVHEVELQGSLAVLGRDPSCDLVLNDAKCSRRHAVVEAGPDGLSIRDSGSANGIYVNAKRVERSPLQEGDEIRLGEVLVKVLPDDMPGTLVMGPDEMMEMGPPAAASALPRQRSQDSTPTVKPAREAAAAPPPPAPLRPLPPPPPPPRAAAPAPPPPPPPRVASAPQAPRPAGLRMGAPEPLPRPLTATVLAVLWLLTAVTQLFWGAYQMWTFSRAGASIVLPLLSTVFTVVLGIVMGIGLLGRQPWGRFLQMAISGLGLITCVFTPLSVLSLYYMTRPHVRVQFSGRQTFRELGDEEAALVRAAEGEGLFTAGVFVCLLIGAILFALIVMLAVSMAFKALSA
jgi:hypothetical protein